MQSLQTMELLRRVAAAVGISLVLTLLLMALYQDDGPSRANRDQAPSNSMAGSR